MPWPLWPFALLGFWLASSSDDDPPPGEAEDDSDYWSAYGEFQIKIEETEGGEQSRYLWFLARDETIEDSGQADSVLDAWSDARAAADKLPQETPEDYEPQPELSPLWPLPSSVRKWKEHSFASGRPYGAAKPTGHHKGIDIRASEGDAVQAMDSGLVTSHTGWDGPNTRGLMVQHDGGPVIVYGAVSPEGMTPIGDRVARGEVIARVGRYPKGDSMLHLELYRAGTRKRPRWAYDAPQPGSLVNPHKYLLATVTT